MSINRRKHCKKFEECHDWIMGCGNLHSDRHAMSCIKNRFCYAHCRIYIEDNYIRKDLTGKVIAKLPWRELRRAGELQKQVYRGSPVTYENPKDPDITELIYEILPIADGEQELDETKKRAESPLTSKTIAFKLRKEKGIGVQPRTVTKRIRELGRKVKGQKKGRYLGYSLDKDD